MFKINNLEVEVDNKTILKDFNLEINNGEVHALMGPNGVGKSTICKTIMGIPNYIVKKGTIDYNGIDILKLNITDRARMGIYLLGQNPVEVPGVSNAEMLRMALNERGENISIFDFNKELLDICKKLSLPKEFIHRGINENASGGEKKKLELMHIWMLKPSLIILDEVDSGLDVDSLKIVANSLNEYVNTYNASILLVSHHDTLIKMLNTNYIHIIKDGSIVRSGDISLASMIENNGYKDI